jgi:glutathione S-transferase
VLEDGDFRLTESSAILKYLADKVSSPAYPKDLKQRAKVNEMMDWLNTQFYREYGYGFIYPQIFPNNKRPDRRGAEGLPGVVEGARAELAEAPRPALDRAEEPVPVRQPDHHRRLPRRGLRLARRDHPHGLRSYPNIKRWLGNMKKLKSWPSVNEVFYGFADMVKAQQFETLQ